MTSSELKAHFDGGGQVLKARDDYEPIFLSQQTKGSEGTRFTLITPSSCSWVNSADAFGPEKLRPRIEPWLTALVQSEHLSVLVGSGLTHAVHCLGTGKQLLGMKPVTFRSFSNEIAREVKRVAEAAGREDGNFEDQVRVANELLRGLRILTADKNDRGRQKKKALQLQKTLKGCLKTFTESILEGECSLVTAGADGRTLAFNYLVNFLMSFASRAGTRERLQLFTTNYDRFIEAGADAAGLRLIDRFVGTLAPVFRASRLDVDLHYNPPGIRGEPRYLEGVARFTKLHGSVDWVDCDGAILRIGLPFGAADTTPYLKAPGMKGIDSSRLMIYPNSAKDRETADFPYVELFRDFAASICRPNSTLVCYGYSFGDEHINRVIEDMLTIPSTHLVVIAWNDPLGRIIRTCERLGRAAQITLMLGNHLGDLRALVDHYLPKPAIDRTTFRMAELLKARWGTEPSQSHNAENSEVDPRSEQP